MTSPPSRPDPRAQAYWRANKRLIVILLLIWATVSFGAGIVLVEPLNRIRLGDVPLGFWMAQQGSIYVFVVLIFVYAWRMDRLDRQWHYDRNSDAAEPGPDAGGEA